MESQAAKTPVVLRTVVPVLSGVTFVVCWLAALEVTTTGGEQDQAIEALVLLPPLFAVACGRLCGLRLSFAVAAVAGLALAWFVVARDLDPNFLPSQSYCETDCWDRAEQLQVCAMLAGCHLLWSVAGAFTRWAHRRDPPVNTSWRGD